MKKLVLKLIVFSVILFSTLFFLTGCTLQIETKDNSISASVDGDTTEKVDNIIDWLKARFSKVFKKEENA